MSSIVLPVPSYISHATSETLVTVLGVVYVHRKTSDGGDIYLTQFGLPVAGLLEPSNWYEDPWFASKRQRLEGTSAVYRAPTKMVDGVALDLVVKNCRMGEDVSLDTHTLMEFMNTEFNSPWEEFSLVLELRGRNWVTGAGVKSFFLTIAAKERRKPSSVLALQLLYKILDSGLRRNDEDELHPPSVPPIEGGKKETSVIRQGVTKGISSPFFCAISLPQRIQQQE